MNEAYWRCDSTYETQENFVDYLCRNCSVCFNGEQDAGRKEEGGDAVHALQKVGRTNRLGTYRVLGCVSHGSTKLRLLKSDDMRNPGSSPEFLSIRHQLSTVPREGEKPIDWRVGQLYSDSMEASPLLPTKSLTISVDEETHHIRCTAAEIPPAGEFEVVGDTKGLPLTTVSEPRNCARKPRQKKKTAVRLFVCQIKTVVKNGIGYIKNKLHGAKDRTKRKMPVACLSNPAKTFCETIRGSQSAWDEKRGSLHFSRNMKSNKTRSNERKNREAAVQRLKAMIEHIHTQNHASRHYKETGEQRGKEASVRSIPSIFVQARKLNKGDNQNFKTEDSGQALAAELLCLATDTSQSHSSLDKLGVILDEYFDQYAPSHLSKIVLPEDTSTAAEREVNKLVASLSYSSGSTEDSSIDFSDIVEHEDHTIEKFGYYQHEFDCYDDSAVYNA